MAAALPDLLRRREEGFVLWRPSGAEDVPVLVSLAMTLGFFFVCLAVVAWIFRTGYRLKS